MMEDVARKEKETGACSCGQEKHSECGCGQKHGREIHKIKLGIKMEILSERNERI